VHKLRFLVQRRWIVFALAVVALAWVAWRLGEWQFHRLEDRQERNEIIQRNEEAGAAPVAEVLAPGRDVALADEWRIVEATGTYAVEDTVIVRYRTREGASGVDVVVPLELADGTSLLVDRGWYATDNRGATTADVPEPPAGEVTVTGWVRRDAEGDSTEVADQSTRAVDSGRIGDALGRDVLGGWVDLRSESPAPETPLVPVELPELDQGPHFFYGLQWWFFGALAIFGFFYLVYDEWRGGRGPWGDNQPPTPETTAPGRTEPARARRRTLRERLDPGDGSEGAEQAAVDREHHARQE